MSKTPPASTDRPAQHGPRRLKPAKYKSFRLQKRIKPVDTKLPGAFRLFAGSLQVLARHWQLFLGISAVYGVLSLVFVEGLSSGVNLSELKTVLEVSGSTSQLVNGLALFTYLMGTSGSAGSGAAGVYQVVLVLITSLALIWTLRQVYAEHKVRIRDGFYAGMYPLVPFVLLVCVVILQLIPFVIGGFLFSTVQTGVVAVTGIETVLWGGVFFLLTLVSLYLLASSLIALYIVCLPDMRPLAALRAARQLVEGRRWVIVRKIIFLPFALLLLSILIMLPIVMFATPIAKWAFFVLGILSLPVVHSYMYRLYRELL